MRLEVLFQAQVPKDANFPEQMEDAVAISTDGDAAAVSDGASESFDSRQWASLLVKEFISGKCWNTSAYQSVLAKYGALYQPSTLSWSKRASFERGSFATLLGIRLDPNSHQLQMLGIGDCLALIAVQGSVISSFPYRFASQFEERPVLLSTNEELSAFVGDDVFMQSCVSTQGVHDDTIVMMMSDALGAWVLAKAEQGESPLALLLSMKSEGELSDFVVREREVRAMRTDDVTLVVLRVIGGAESELSVS